ncbi:MAG: glycosyltransferase family 2 protein [Clostridia bacterium]|nr:glycosyltransferase family 2 protein [Clostridia bacterium]
MVQINSYVTGCIVTHNNMSSIDETITTLLENTKGVDFKLTVVDNMSTDSTPAHIREKYPEVKVIEPHTNNGFGCGHNIVLSELDSKYHCVINPDISISDDVIAKMAAYMDEHPEIGLLSPRICFPDGRMQILGKRNPKIKYLVASRMRGDEPGKLLREYAMLDEDLDSPLEIENATGCFMMFRTELFKKLGGFDKRYFMYFEDCDITRSVAKHAKVIYYPEAVVYHVWGRESKKNFRLMLVQISSMFKYFAKWCKG